MEIRGQHNQAFTGLNRKLAQGIISKRITDPKDYYNMENMAQYLKSSSVDTVLKPVKDSKRRLQAVITDANNKEHVMQEGKLASFFSPTNFVRNVVEFVKNLEK